MIKKAVLFAVGLVLAFALGFCIGWSSAEPEGESWSSQIFGAGLPEEFANRGGPLVEDLRSRDFRLAIASFNEHLRITGHRTLRGHFKLAVLDAKAKPVYVLENGEANSDCQADYSEFTARGMIKLVYYTWDHRKTRDVPWKVEVLVFHPEAPLESHVRFALPAEPGDAKLIASLAAQARKSFELSRKTAAGSARADQAFALGERSLNQLRNIGMGKPAEVIKCFRAMKWADGAVLEAVDQYVGELSEVQRVRAKGSRERDG